MKNKIKGSVDWYLAWIIQYWKGLTDFNFDKYFIYQMLPMAYGTLLFAIAAGILYLIIETFIAGQYLRGAFYFFVAGPLSFLVLASILRALVELYMVIFRIAEDVDELVGITDTIEKLSGIRETVDEMSAVTHNIPFFKRLAGIKDKDSSRKKSQRSSKDESESPDSEAGPGDSK